MQFLKIQCRPNKSSEFSPFLLLLSFTMLPVSSLLPFIFNNSRLCFLKPQCHSNPLSFPLSSEQVPNLQLSLQGLPLTWWQLCDSPPALLPTSQYPQIFPSLSHLCTFSNTIPMAQRIPFPTLLSFYVHSVINSSNKYEMGSFPGGAVVKNPPANAGYTGSSPGPGRSHMPRSS